MAIAAAVSCALAACSMTPDPADTVLGSRIDAAPGMTVVGEKLDVALLRAFYTRHDFAPVWPTHEAQANRLVDAVLHAGDQGLDPELFHGTTLKHLDALTPTDRDLILSDAFLTYADALARGAVPVERRKDYEALTPEPVDIPATLDKAIDSDDPAATIEALAPSTPNYLALRKALKKCRTSGGKSPPGCLRRIEVNLERERWLPRSLPANRVWVNVAAEQLALYQDDHQVFSTKIIVGEDVERNQSPEFHTDMDGSWLNPPWVIPSDIAAREIMPKIKRDPDYLKRNKMVMIANGEIEQLPGPDAGLGQLMFSMPNRFDVYLHDTPDRNLFNRDNRRLSHGCIRVQNPRQFAALLMQRPIDYIDQEIAAGATVKKEFPAPVPVYVVYSTAFVDMKGVLQFTTDFYNRDGTIWQALQPHAHRHGHGSHGDSV